MGDLHPALRDYLLQLRALAPGSAPSVFWERQLAKFQATYERIETLTPEELDELVAAGSYGFQDLPDSSSRPQEDPAYERVSRGVGHARKEAKKATAPVLGWDKEAWEHLRALDFLRRRELEEEYLTFITPLRLRSDMSTARHWYYARQIAELAEHAGLTPPLDVLEIGAGAGNLAYFLTTMRLVRSYTIIDLPEMLVHSAYTLQRRIPELDIAFAEPDLHPGRYRFIPDFRAADLIDDHSVDLALNLNSFMEMDREARDAYIEQIYRCTRPGGLFYNVNRRQRKLPLRDGGTWDNNPLLYPYRHDDEIVVWEEDPFQTATRAKWGELASLAITRASIVRPNANYATQA
jgi:SAM-dependent methyltransferase